MIALFGAAARAARNRRGGDLVGWAAIALLLSAGIPAHAQGIDLTQGGPIQITSQDGIEWRQAEQIVIAKGDAKAVRGNVTITADRLIAWYRRKGAEAASQPVSTGMTGATDTEGNEVYRMRAEGNVHISTPTDQAWGDQATYDLDQTVLVMTGNGLKLTTPSDTLTARDTLEYWSAKHMAVARGDAVVVTNDARRISADTLVAFTTVPPAAAGAKANGSATPGATAKSAVGSASPGSASPGSGSQAPGSQAPGSQAPGSQASGSPPSGVAASGAAGNGSKPSGPAGDGRTPAASGAAPPAAGGDTMAAMAGKLERVEAFNNVSIRTVSDIVTGDRGVYVPDTGIAHLGGHVRITRGMNQIDGSETVVNMKTGVATLLAGDSGRVTGLVVPNDQTNPPPGTAGQPGSPGGQPKPPQPNPGARP